MMKHLNNWFFHQERGKVVGPFTLDDMRARIRDGRLRLFDLIYREGEPGWRMALEHPELRDHFKGAEQNDLSERPWVCLHRKSNVGYDFVTMGPYTLAEVQEAIRSGKLSYNDYAWKNGFIEWKRIGSLAEFDRKRELDTFAAPSSELKEPHLPSKEEMLRNVIEMRRPPVRKEEPRPKEAKGEDLTKVEPPPVPAAARVRVRKRVDTVPPPVPPAPVSSARVSKRWVDVGIVAALALVLVGTISHFMWRKFHSPSYVASETPPALPNSELAMEGKGELTPTAGAQDGPNSLPAPTPPHVSPGEAGKGTNAHTSVQPTVESTANQEVEELDADLNPVHRGKAKEKHGGKQPTELSLSIQGRGANQPRIDIRSNGSTDIPVYVQIVGVPGQVAESASFYRYLKFSSTGTHQPLDLSKVDLPQGRFILRVETGSLHKEMPFSFGTGDVQFKQSVAKARKQYSSAIWQERLNLYRLSEQLERALLQAQTNHRFKGGGFDSLAGVKKATGSYYLLFDDWWELKQIWQEARQGSTSPELIQRTRRVQEKMASFSVTHTK